MTRKKREEEKCPAKKPNNEIDEINKLILRKEAEKLEINMICCSQLVCFV